MIGSLSDKGYDLADLERVKAYFEEQAIKCELVNLNQAFNQADEQAYVLICRGAAWKIVNADELFFEQKALKHDKKVRFSFVSFDFGSGCDVWTSGAEACTMECVLWQ